jgi:putative transcriptional regulator
MITLEYMSTIYKGVRGADMQEHNHARQEIASQLRQVRKEQGMTQERLAEKVGTRKSNISRLESGRYNPSLDFLEKVAGGLGREIEVKVT